MKWCQHHKTSFIFPSPTSTTKIRHLPLNNASMRVVGSRPYAKGLRNLPTCASGNSRETSVSLAVPAETCELIPVPVSHSPGVPKEQWLGSPPWTRKPMCPGFQKRISSTPVEKKIFLECIGMDKRNRLTFLAPPFLKDGTAYGWDIISHDFSHSERGEQVSVFLTSPTVWYTSKETPFYLEESRLLNCKFHD